MPSSVISYSIATTAIDAAATSLTIAPPPLRAAGNLLVMVVAGGSTTGAAVGVTTPSGWTAQSAAGAGMAVFTKTATASEPASYTVTMASSCAISAYVAAYPGATVTSHTFAASSAGTVTYTSSYPSGVAAGKLVLVTAAAVAGTSNAGYHNVVYPSGLNTAVPVFGQALPDNVPGVSPCAAGLSDVASSVMAGLATPVYTSPQPGIIYTGYLVLTVTGPNTAAAALAVTATASSATGLPGLALTVKALSGAASPAAIAAGGAAVSFYANGMPQAPAAAITPRATGSLVYGALTQNFGVTAGTAYTANTATAFSQNVSDAAYSANYGTLRSSGTTTAGTPVTLGGSAPASAYTTAALAEILAAPGSTLAETATATVLGDSPANYPATAVAQTAYFATPPAGGSLLVATVSANSSYTQGTTAVTVTDSLGLTWTPLAQQGYPSYSGVFTAQLPPSVSPNVGAGADSGGSTSLTQALTVPAGVKGGDVVLLHADAVILTTTAPTVTVTSTGTTPHQAHAPVTGTESSPTAAAVSGVCWYFTAAGTTGAASSDVGKVITFTASAASYWSAALFAYSGCNTGAPVDVVNGAFGGANSNTVTAPVLTTGQAGDWAVYLGGGAVAGGSFAGPSGSTQRVSDSSSVNVSAGIFDSGAQVGAAGTSIGGGTFTSASTSTALLTAFTVGLAVAASGPSPCVPRRPARGRTAARTGAGRGQAGAKYTYIPPGPLAPFPAPHRAVAPHPGARKGKAAGSPGAKYVYVQPGPVRGILDESGGNVLDEAGGYVLDEGAPSVISPAEPHVRVKGRQAARRGAGRGSNGAPYVYVPVIPAPFALPHQVAARHPSARKGRAASSPGARYVYVPVIPAVFAFPVRAVPPHPSARRGTSASSPGAPHSAASPVLDYWVLDEAGSPVLDEGGGNVEDESAPFPVAGTLTWTAARAGMPHDSGAVNYPDQAAQFLISHGTVPVYAGNRIWTTATASPSAPGYFFWLSEFYLGWLPAYDVSQPFVMPAGSTTVGRVQVPVQVSGNGADLQVTLCPDNGSGSPNLARPLAAATLPASHVTAQAASGSLASAGPLAVARCNTSLLGPYSTGPWSQPAVSSNGAGSFASPATSGNFTVLAGGYDSVAAKAIGTVTVIAYQGTSVSGGAAQPSLPQPAYYAAATITADSVMVAGGANTAFLSSVWTAPWAPGTGTVGAWSQQQALPSPVVSAAAASWGTQVYVIGGTPDQTAANATAAVWTASAQSGQVTTWTAAPSLPAKVSQPYAAVVGNWLVVAGGQNTSGVPVANTWYSAINPDGSLAGWQQGPSLPQPGYSLVPGWNLAVTDSAVVIVSGAVASGVSRYTQILSVSPDGPGDAWQLQNWTEAGSGGEFQTAAYPAGPSGQWQVFNLHTTSYDTAQLGPVALVSVPLPATGLTPGATYHVVMHQSGGSLTDSLQVGVVQTSASGQWLSAPAGTGGPWLAQASQEIAVNVMDQTPGGPVLHLTEDGGARITSPVWSGSGTLLTGLMESTAFPVGSPEAVTGTVTQVQWTDGCPTGLVNLA